MYISVILFERNVFSWNGVLCYECKVCPVLAETTYVFNFVFSCIRDFTESNMKDVKGWGQMQSF